MCCWCGALIVRLPRPVTGRAMFSALTLLRAADTHQDRDRWSYVILVEEHRGCGALRAGG
jgi:hypothetical protein